MHTVGLIVCCTVLSAVTGVATSILLDSSRAEPQITRARSFELVNAEGRVVARLSPSAQSKSPTLVFYSGDGKEKAVVGLEGEHAYLHLFGPEPASRVMFNTRSFPHAAYIGNREDRLVLDFQNHALHLLEGYGAKCNGVRIEYGAGKGARLIRGGKELDIIE